jgi:hypothetical protein
MFGVTHSQLPSQHPFIPLGIHDPTIAKDIVVWIVESQNS